MKDKLLSDYLKVLMEIVRENHFTCKIAVKLAVADNPGTPPDILDLLVEDKNSDNSANDIKQSVARNPNTSLQTLFKLSKSRTWSVGNNVRCNDKWKDPDREEKIKELELFYLLERELKSRSL